MIIFLLIIIAFELWFLIYDLEKYYPKYLDKKTEELDKRLIEIKKINYFILHSKSPEELKRIKEREDKYNSKNFSGVEEREITREEKNAKKTKSQKK